MPPKKNNLKQFANVLVISGAFDAAAVEAVLTKYNSKFEPFAGNTYFLTTATGRTVNTHDDMITDLNALVPPIVYTLTFIADNHGCRVDGSATGIPNIAQIKDIIETTV